MELTKQMLTDDQKNALSGILEFIQRPIEKYKDCSTILYAAAGCGKSFLTRFIADKIRGKLVIAGVAPTHKARKVLDKFLNANAFIHIKTMTVASLLGKIRTHSYIGTNHYDGDSSKISLYNLFIIDEASMINDEDVKKIISYAYNFKRKIIFVGDKYQIPNPSQQYVFENGFAYKADSIAFNISGFELTTNVRQKENNPIIPIYWELRNAIAEKREPNIPKETLMFNVKDKSDICSTQIFNKTKEIGVKFYKNIEPWYLKMFSLLKESSELHNIRIIAYTNDAVKKHNQTIRTMFGREPESPHTTGYPEIGELLMGYNNVGFPEPYISNGQDYYVVERKYTSNYRIREFYNLSGMVLKIKESDTNILADIFIPDISKPENQPMLIELVRRAEKVNSSYSTKQDYRKYFEIRNKLIFMENIYRYHNEILGESQFRCNNPLLFKKITEVIGSSSQSLIPFTYNLQSIDTEPKRLLFQESNLDRHSAPKLVVLENKLSEDISEKYGDILTRRIADNKAVTEIEKICDQFCIIEKDIDFGYAVTAHKSQGSTYKSVFIDEADFEKLKDHFSYKLGCEIKTVKEKNQLKYVSYTRASDSAHIFHLD